MLRGFVLVHRKKNERILIFLASAPPSRGGEKLMSKCLFLEVHCPDNLLRGEMSVLCAGDGRNVHQNSPGGILRTQRASNDNHGRNPPGDGRLDASIYYIHIYISTVFCPTSAVVSEPNIKLSSSLTIRLSPPTEYSTRGMAAPRASAPLSSHLLSTHQPYSGYG